MGLEIAISVRSGRTDGVMKKRGDFICAKLENSPWGSDELKHQAIVRITDDVIAGISDDYLRGKMQSLVTKLGQARGLGEPWPVRALPTAQWAVKGLRRRPVQRSRIYLNFTLANPALTTQWLDPDVSVPVQEIPADRIDATVRYRNNPSIDPEETLVNEEDSY